jgi:hypothetical protein
MHNIYYRKYRKIDPYAASICAEMDRCHGIIKKGMVGINKQANEYNK